MKISNQQLHYLLLLLKDSIAGLDVVNMFSLSFDDRVKLHNQILQQQDRTIVELDDYILKEKK